MELNLTTFILEMVNFLVLMWILKRLFYAPIKAMIDSRKAEIKRAFEEAGKTKAEAEASLQQVESRLKEWSREHDAKLDDLKRDIEKERMIRMKELHTELDNERERVNTLELAEQSEKKIKQEREAILQSLAFLSKLLAGIASPEVESAILRVFLRNMEKDQRFPNKNTAPVLVHSAFPLGEKEKTDISNAFAKFLGHEFPQVSFGLDPSLLAGFEVTVGAMVLRANLRDELDFFSKAAIHG